MDKLVPKQKS